MKICNLKVCHRMATIKRRITRHNPCPTKRKAGLVLAGGSIQYDDIRIKRALTYNYDLSNEFVVATPERGTEAVLKEIENTGRIVKKAKRKQPATRKANRKHVDGAGTTAEVQQIQTMFGEIEDFELMKEVVPKDRYVVKATKQRKNKNRDLEPNPHEEFIPSTISDEQHHFGAIDETPVQYVKLPQCSTHQMVMSPDEDQIEPDSYTQEDQIEPDSYTQPQKMSQGPNDQVEPDSYNDGHQKMSQDPDEDRIEPDSYTQPQKVQQDPIEDQIEPHFYSQPQKVQEDPIEDQIEPDSYTQPQKVQQDPIEDQIEPDSYTQPQKVSIDPSEEQIELDSYTDEHQKVFLYEDQIEPNSGIQLSLHSNEDQIEQDLYTQPQEVSTDPSESQIEPDSKAQLQRVSLNRNEVQIEKDSQCEKKLEPEENRIQPDPNIELKVVLELSNRPNVINWHDFASSSSTSFEKCSKLGEGTYGEVFKISIDGKDAALKVIPFAVKPEECNKLVNGDYLKPPTSTYNELLITKELSKLSSETQTALTGFVTAGFIHFIQVAIVKGLYPEPLLQAWDRYKIDKPLLAENQRPSEYATEGQHFILFALSNGGLDLESYKIQKQRQSYSIFYQLAISLAAAEEALEFEHRDLHIGNVLVDMCNDEEILRYIYEGQYIDIKSCGVRASIIDFTNSRIRKDELVVYIDLSEDKEIFEGKGDYQFDIYRMMREENRNNWIEFTPKTNLLWLHYLSRKLFDIPRLFRKRRMPLLEMFDKMLAHERIRDFLNDEQFLEEFGDYRV